jgi:hypothetical protein
MHVCIAQTLIGITFLTFVEGGRAEKVYAAPKGALRSDFLVVQWTDDQSVQRLELRRDGDIFRGAAAVATLRGGCIVSKIDKAWSVCWSPRGRLFGKGSLGPKLPPVEAPPDAAARAERLIEDLNLWVRGGGDPEHRPPSVKSTGEANAAFIEVKRRLEALHVAYAWDGTRYVLKPSE